MKSSKILKRLLSTFAIIFLLVLVAAVAIPYFFKDEILAKVKEEANKALDAEVDFSDVSLSLLRNFPDFSFRLSDLEVKGIHEFEGTNLVNAKNIDFTLDLMSVIKSARPIEINSIAINDVDMDVQVLSNGAANYMIVKESEEKESSSSDFVVNLEAYEVTNLNLIYQDKTGEVFFEMNDLDHSGSGDFTQDIFNLNTQTTVDGVTARTGGVHYLKNADVNIDAILSVDVPNNKFTLKENNLTVNAMTVFCEGWLQIPDGDGLNLDFSFDAPKNNFKHLLSLIPGAYTKDFEGVKAEGAMAFSGFVKGVYSGRKNIFPAFKVKLDIENGNFQYPDMPLGINDIYTKAIIESPNLDLDKMKIDIPNFKLNLGGKPFAGRFKLRTPLSDPDVDTEVKGIIDLADLNKAFPMEGVAQLTGILNADVVMKTRMSTIDKGNYEKVNMSGSASLKQFNYVAQDVPKIKINDTQIDFTPRHAMVNDFSGKIGNSDIKASGKIDNILAYFSPNKTMTGDIKMRSQFFDVNEWMTEPDVEAQTITPSTTEVSTEIFDRFKFDFDAQLGKVAYDVYDLTNVAGKGSFSPNKLALKEFQTKIGKSDVRGKGELTNIFGYVFDNETLGGNLDLTSNFFDLNELMEAAPSGKVTARTIANTEEAMEIVVIPSNINMDIDAKIKKVIYTNLDLNDMKGSINVKDGIVSAKNVVASTLGGQFTADGSYNTQNPETPLYNLKYDVKKFDFQKAFKKLNTFKAAMPIAEFLNGSFSTDMSMKGELGKDMFPKLETITAKGFMQTVNGFMHDLKPLKEIGEKLNIKALKNHKINLKGTKNWFEVEDGFVNVKEFPLDFEGIKMKIAGKHSFQHEMDYNIKAKIPTKLIGKGSAGAAAQSGLKFLNEQASKIGVDLNVGEFVNVLINLKGGLKNPKVNIKLLSSEGEAATITDVVKKVVDTAVDSAKVVVTEKIEDTKAAARAKAEAEIKIINDKAEVQIKKLMDEANKQADALRKEGEKAAAKAKEEGYKQADLLVEKAGSNPFKKKAAEIAAGKLKEKTDTAATKIETEANAKADLGVKKAEEQADGIRNRAKAEADKVRKKYE